MKIFKFFAFLTLISLTAISCGKDDTTAPVITMTSPVEGTVLSPGSEFTVKGTVTDNEELDEIILSGVKVTSFTSKASHTIDAQFKVDSLQTLGDVNFDIVAKDKEGNTASKTIKLKIQ